MSAARWPLLMLVVVLWSTGCADRLSGAGSMNIDVEVYKGPLAQDPWTQWGELLGAVSEAKRAVASTQGFASIVFKDLGCEPAGLADPRKLPKPPEPKDEKKAVPDPMEAACQLPPTNQSQDCNSLKGLICFVYPIHYKEKMLTTVDEELKDIKIGDVTPATRETTRNQVRIALQEIARVATQMRGAAFFVAGAQLSSPTNERRARTALTNGAVALSEYANQIFSRADALLQQMAGPDRRELPLSLQLRNTNPTDFLNLYIWNRAAGWALAADMVLRLPTAFASEETASRVRGYEQLFADYNWSNVNSVYASGQGDVAMAFIKDDIGNWNLKAFDNDPAELLKAYTAVGKAALVEAADAVKAATGFGAAAEGVGTAVSGAKQLTELANRVAFGRTSASQPTVGGLDVAALHERVVRDIAGLKGKAAAERTALRAKIAADEQEKQKLVDRQVAKRGEAAAKRREKPPATSADAADLEREAERNKQQLFEYDQQILRLEKEIEEGVAPSPPGQESATDRLTRLKGERNALESRREANLKSARTAREDAEKAADLEAEALKLDAEAKSLDDATATEKTETHKASLEKQPQATAKEAREILEQYAKLINLLEEGVATGPADGRPSRIRAPTGATELPGELPSLPTGTGILPQ